MGPQLYRCGNMLYNGWQLDTVKVASMGPQLYRCGNMQVRFYHHLFYTRFNGATTLSLWK